MLKGCVIFKLTILKFGWRDTLKKSIVNLDETLYKGFRDNLTRQTVSGLARSAKNYEGAIQKSRAASLKSIEVKYIPLTR
jgi:hypothetical protein